MDISTLIFLLQKNRKFETGPSPGGVRGGVPGLEISETIPPQNPGAGGLSTWAELSRGLVRTPSSEFIQHPGPCFLLGSLGMWLK